MCHKPLGSENVNYLHRVASICEIDLKETLVVLSSTLKKRITVKQAKAIAVLSAELSRFFVERLCFLSCT